ncbi:MAG TPA: class I SAM-dependent methyltransferase [Solirubrobacteraceae bacterium]|nr:class I SAM-dependent methyltransferase [Solirubrobacteraceae bacterium]
MSDAAQNLERAAPLPPRALAIRAGVPDQADVIASYRAVGRDSRTTILELLGPSWSFRGKRVLDFGCGSGKVMRHFLPEAEQCELWGCDIDARSVDWINAELHPPLYAFANAEAPPLDQPSSSFDLVWSVSVFTHLTDHWAGWLAELHRLLRPGGLAIISFLGGAMYEVYSDEPWEPDRVGMLVLDHGQDWELGGPTVFHSPWWLREHWGRAFEIVELREGVAPREHGLVLLRRRSDVIVTPQLLERIDAAREPREIDALRRQVKLLQREASALRAARDALALADARRLPRRVAGRLGQMRRGDR